MYLKFEFFNSSKLLWNQLLIIFSAVLALTDKILFDFPLKLKLINMR